jgi:GrpB-like predicted nucleotidyltransferase (UPF0157 family)
MPTGSPRFIDELAFRDYLRDHPARAMRYGELKTDLAARYRHDREAYTEAKTEFVRSTLALARSRA